MNTDQRKALKEKILAVVKSSESKPTRMSRLMKEPVKAIPFFCKQIVARIKPFKVSYKTLWGDRMEFYLPEGNAIYYYGFYEADLANFFINAIQDGDTFFDVGTHVGYYTLLAAHLAAPSGSVHGFEPTPRTFKTLSENVERNASRNETKSGDPISDSATAKVFLNNVAVLDHETEIDFVDYGPKNSAFNSYKSRSGKGMEFLGKGEPFKAKTISLDAYCKEKNVSPTVIKIDAEGAEHLILQSMHEILANAKPIVTIEVGGGAEWKHNCDQSIDFLLGKGYQCFETNIEGKIKPHQRQEIYHYDNLIFIHPDKMNRAQQLLA